MLLFIVLTTFILALTEPVLSTALFEFYEVGPMEFKAPESEPNTTWPIVTLPKMDVKTFQLKNNSKSPRCLCKLPLPIPIPVPVPPMPGVGVNNNVAATQLLSDGRTALYNNAGQIIGYLPAGSTVQNQNPFG